jgi:hypothetical protein
VTRSKWLALGALATLQLGDFISTRLALARPGVVEIGLLPHYTDLLGAKLFALVLCTLLVVINRKPARLWGVCGVYALIVLSNLRLAL